MTLQNRVLPDGSIVADPARGIFTGNRGILHNAGQQLGTSRWTHPHWICCALQFKNRRRTVMTGRNWTELFFLDEAVALAAGHRPCAECRREAYNRYVAAWTAATGSRPSAKAIDKALHKARVVPRTRAQIRFDAEMQDLPDGCFVWQGGTAWLVRGDALLPYAPQGYGPARPRPSGGVSVMTPLPSVLALRHGFRPELHPSALT